MSKATMKHKTNVLDQADELNDWGFKSSCCDQCGIMNSEIDGFLLQCGRCKKAYYCSYKCFKEGLPTHQKFCLTHAVTNVDVTRNSTIDEKACPATDIEIPKEYKGYDDNRSRNSEFDVTESSVNNVTISNFDISKKDKVKNKVKVSKKKDKSQVSKKTCDATNEKVKIKSEKKKKGNKSIAIDEENTDTVVHRVEVLNPDDVNDESLIQKQDDPVDSEKGIVQEKTSQISSDASVLTVDTTCNDQSWSEESQIHHDEEIEVQNTEKVAAVKTVDNELLQNETKKKYSYFDDDIGAPPFQGKRLPKDVSIESRDEDLVKTTVQTNKNIDDKTSKEYDQSSLVKNSLEGNHLIVEDLPNLDDSHGENLNHSYNDKSHSSYDEEIDVQITKKVSVKILYPAMIPNENKKAYDYPYDDFYAFSTDVSGKTLPLDVCTGSLDEDLGKTKLDEPSLIPNENKKTYDYPYDDFYTCSTAVQKSLPLDVYTGSLDEDLGKTDLDENATKRYDQQKATGSVCSLTNNPEEVEDGNIRRKFGGGMLANDATLSTGSSTVTCLYCEKRNSDQKESNYQLRAIATVGPKQYEDKPDRKLLNRRADGTVSIHTRCPCGRLLKSISYCLDKDDASKNEDVQLRTTVTEHSKNYEWERPDWSLKAPLKKVTRYSLDANDKQQNQFFPLGSHGTINSKSNDGEISRRMLNQPRKSSLKKATSYQEMNLRPVETGNSKNYTWEKPTWAAKPPIKSKPSSLLNRTSIGNTNTSMQMKSNHEKTSSNTTELDKTNEGDNITSPLEQGQYSTSNAMERIGYSNSEHSPRRRYSGVAAIEELKNKGSEHSWEKPDWVTQRSSILRTSGHSLRQELQNNDILDDSASTFANDDLCGSEHHVDKNQTIFHRNQLSTNNTTKSKSNKHTAKKSIRIISIENVESNMNEKSKEKPESDILQNSELRSNNELGEPSSSFGTDFHDDNSRGTNEKRKMTTVNDASNSGPRRYSGTNLEQRRNGGNNTMSDIERLGQSKSEHASSRNSGRVSIGELKNKRSEHYGAKSVWVTDRSSILRTSGHSVHKYVQSADYYVQSTDFDGSDSSIGNEFYDSENED